MTFVPFGLGTARDPLVVQLGQAEVLRQSNRLLSNISVLRVPLLVQVHYLLLIAVFLFLKIHRPLPSIELVCDVSLQIYRCESRHQKTAYHHEPFLQPTDIGQPLQHVIRYAPVYAHLRGDIQLQAEELVSDTIRIVILPAAGVELPEFKVLEVKTFRRHYVEEVGLVQQLVLMEFGQQEAGLFGAPLVV